MFANVTGPSLADIAAVTGKNNDNNGFGDGGWWVLIILFALFGGWGNNGWGGNGGNNGVGAEVQRGFDTQSIISKLDGINNGLCDGFYATNNTIQQGNFGIQNAMNQGFYGLNTAMNQGFNAAQAQLADCCCENRAAIAQVRYDMATDTCAITTAMNQGFAQIDRTINDKFCELQIANMQRQIDEQQSLIQSLNLAQSQANQNQYLIEQLRPQAKPAWNVPNPYAGYGYGCCNQQPSCCCN